MNDAGVRLSVFSSTGFVYNGKSHKRMIFLNFYSRLTIQYKEWLQFAREKINRLEKK